MLLLATKAHISAAVLGHVIASLQKLGFWICWCMFDAVLCQNTDHGTVRLTLLTFQEADLDQGQRRRPETSGSAMATMALVLSDALWHAGNRLCCGGLVSNIKHIHFWISKLDGLELRHSLQAPGLMGETGYLNQHVPGHQNVTTPWKQTDALTWPVKIYDTSATVQSDAGVRQQKTHWQHVEHHHLASVYVTFKVAASIQRGHAQNHVCQSKNMTNSTTAWTWKQKPGGFQFAVCGQRQSSFWTLYPSNLYWGKGAPVQSKTAVRSFSRSTSKCRSSTRQKPKSSMCFTVSLSHFFTALGRRPQRSRRMAVPSAANAVEPLLFSMKWRKATTASFSVLPMSTSSKSTARVWCTPCAPFDRNQFPLKGFNFTSTGSAAPTHPEVHWEVMVATGKSQHCCKKDSVFGRTRSVQSAAAVLPLKRLGHRDRTSWKRSRARSSWTLHASDQAAGSNLWRGEMEK